MMACARSLTSFFPHRSGGGGVGRGGRKKKMTMLVVLLVLTPAPCYSMTLACARVRYDGGGDT